MIFLSIEFFIILSLFLILFYLLPIRLRIYSLIIFSVYFYIEQVKALSVLLLLTSTLDYFISKNLTKRKYLLMITMHLIILFYFKYFNWFYSLLGIRKTIPSIIGISFYTFHSIMYLTDIFTKRYEPSNKWTDYFYYIIFFPQILIGYIQSYKHYLDNKSSFKFDEDNILLGVQLIIFGLIKKMVIADNAYFIIKEIMNLRLIHPGFMVILAILFYVFIYNDFSGYINIASGLGLLFNYRFPINFNKPYIAGSVKDFWKRWHICLTTFFKNYVYIPLGGNKTHYVRNVIIVFLISALWHGAGFNFIVWGLFHAFFYFFEDLYLTKSKILNWFISQSVIAFSWLIFFNFDFTSLDLSINNSLVLLLHFNVVVILVFIAWLAFALRTLLRDIEHKLFSPKLYYLYIIIGLVILLVCRTNGLNRFYYFIF